MKEAYIQQWSPHGVHNRNILTPSHGHYRFYTETINLRLESIILPDSIRADGKSDVGLSIGTAYPNLIARTSINHAIQPNSKTNTDFAINGSTGYAFRCAFHNLL